MMIWYPQEQRASCVAACVRMVLSGFEQSLTERQIRSRLGQLPFGLSLTGACQQMQRLGMHAELHSDWGLLDLRDCAREGWNPIVGIERRFFGHSDALHAVVLIEVGGQTIRVFDPLGSSQSDTFGSETFEQAWYSAGHQALVIKSPFPPELL